MAEKEESYIKDTQAEIDRHSAALLQIKEQRALAVKHWEDKLNEAAKLEKPYVLFRNETPVDVVPFGTKVV